MEVQYCIGAGCVQQGYCPAEFDRDITTNGNYIVEQYSAVTNYKNFLLFKNKYGCSN